MFSAFSDDDQQLNLAIQRVTDLSNIYKTITSTHMMFHSVFNY